MTTSHITNLRKQSYHIRKNILDISYHGKVGHIAPALSIADIISVLYFHVLHVSATKPLLVNRDRLILSKGHAAAALYAALYQKRFISKKQLFTFCLDAGLLGVHPDYNPKIGIELTTGSLGHGLSVGVGMAMGLRDVHGKKTHTVNPASSAGRRELKTGNHIPRVFVLVSDAELNEGSFWEAVMFASHHSIYNVAVIVDDNGNQAFGKTKDILNLQPLARKFRAFGWNTLKVNGHDIPSLVSSFTKSLHSKSKPTAIIAKTISGYGVSFMKGKVDWHYWPLDKEKYKQALEEIKLIKNK